MVLMEENPEKNGESLKEWRESVEGKGLRISRNKTAKIVFEFGESYRTRQVFQLADDEICEVDRSKYFV